MSNVHLSRKAEAELAELWKLEKEAIKILELIVAEWKTDPMSVQCFDLRVVERAKQIIERLNQLTPDWTKI